MQPSRAKHYNKLLRQREKAEKLNGKGLCSRKGTVFCMQNGNAKGKGDTQIFTVRGFRIAIRSVPAFYVTGFTTFAKEDGWSIAAFLRQLREDGSLSQLQQLCDQLPPCGPQQVWVCLSGNEGRADADYRCTVCVQLSEPPGGAQLLGRGLFTLYAPESEWAEFTVAPGQSPRELHAAGVYAMVAEIGYGFNGEVGFHLDNEHEWSPGGTMRFLLPVTRR